MDKQKLYDVVTEIIKRGNNVEIRKAPDGGLQIFEIKKHKVT